MKVLFTECEKESLLANEIPNPNLGLQIKDLEGAVLFGAGNFGKMVLDKLTDAGVSPSYFIDNDPSRWGTKFQGIPVSSPAFLSEVRETLVVITNSFFREMATDCFKAGVKNWTYFSEIAGIFDNLSILSTAKDVLENPEILRVPAILATDESLEVLRNALAARITGGTLPYTVDQYFPEGLIPDHFYRNFVDCGAFTGDTLADWIRLKGNKFQAELVSYDAFEPELHNFAALKKNLDTLRPSLRKQIRLHNNAISNVEGFLTFSSNQAGSSSLESGTPGQEVLVTTLDAVLREQRVSFIKMDIESFEIKALEGARQILAKNRPALAISNYHLTEHLWQIPLWIHDLNLKYKIHMRHHSPTFGETVCYAVPE